MRRIMLKSKLHNAVVTETELSYAGSLTLDRDLMEVSDILANERVQVVNLNNGARFETYVIEGERGMGQICLNGPAARLGHQGDRIHILTYATVSDEELADFQSVVVVLDEKNHIISRT
ncbi:aspartate 1-decarboxylase [Candidatus Latescibacterota bacterium]